MTVLSVADLIRDRRYEAAIARMQELVRAGDPTEPVDAAAVRAEYEARRRHLRSVVEPPPFRYVGTYVRSER